MVTKRCSWNTCCIDNSYKSKFFGLTMAPNTNSVVVQENENKSDMRSKGLQRSNH